MIGGVWFERAKEEEIELDEKFEQGIGKKKGLSTDDNEYWDGGGNEGDDLSEVGDVVLERDGLARGGVEEH